MKYLADPFACFMFSLIFIFLEFKSCRYFGCTQLQIERGCRCRCWQMVVGLRCSSFKEMADGGLLCDGKLALGLTSTITS
jgi:hypothetical protein